MAHMAVAPPKTQAFEDTEVPQLPQIPHRQQAIKIMVVGDSISHGRQGDWTWRYRLWEWFREQSIPIQFVGPFKGTVPPEEPEAPQPPPFQDEPAPSPKPFRTDGGYALGISHDFLANSDHFSASGRQVYQARWLVAEQVAAYQPDLCLVQLGFNDLGWNVAGPVDTIANMHYLIGQARSAKPDLKFAVANVPQRTDVPGHEDLPVNTDIYNALLARSIPQWSTEESPIALVHFCENYSCGGQNSDAAYDGLHPNALGEYQIAQAFSRTLMFAFGLGSSELFIPWPLPPRILQPIVNLKATPAPSGIVVTWDPVYGAYEYDVSIVGEGGDRWRDFVTTQTNRHDTRFCRAGYEWRYQVRARCGDVAVSPWTDPAAAIANPQTAPPPRNIQTHATSEGFTISWDPLPEEVVGPIDRYGVITFDNDSPGSFPCVVGVKGTYAEIKGLVPGHHYGVAVETWTKAGGGFRRGAKPVTVGKPRFPLSPVVTGVHGVDTTTAEVAWVGDSGAAGYRIWARPKPSGGASGTSREPLCVAEVIAGGPGMRFRRRVPRPMLPSVWDHEFAVISYNGSDNCGSFSNWETPRFPNGRSASNSQCVGTRDTLNINISLSSG